MNLTDIYTNKILLKEKKCGQMFLKSLIKVVNSKQDLLCNYFYMNSFIAQSFFMYDMSVYNIFKRFKLRVL